MGSSSGFFDGSNVDKSESLLLDESVEKKDGTLPDLSDSLITKSSGVRRRIGRVLGIGVVSGVGRDVGGEFESGDGG